MIKHLLIYIPYKIRKQSLISIDFIASVYELFDNPSYCPLIVNFQLNKPAINLINLYLFSL